VSGCVIDWLEKVCVYWFNIRKERGGCNGIAKDERIYFHGNLDDI
jgi:hypothetical protein